VIEESAYRQTEGASERLRETEREKLETAKERTETHN